MRGFKPNPHESRVGVGGLERFSADEPLLPVDRRARMADAIREARLQVQPSVFVSTMQVKNAPSGSPARMPAKKFSANSLVNLVSPYSAPPRSLPGSNPRKAKASLPLYFPVTDECV
jgi:hypothetical protein